MRPSNHVHTGDDGRGVRDVFLNGTLLKHVIYADTKRGIVRVVDNPPNIDKHNKRVLSHTLRGAVEVVAHD